MGCGANIERNVYILLVIYIICARAAPAGNNVARADWEERFSLPTNLLISLVVFVSAVIAFACCSCQACTSKGEQKTQQFHEHTHKMKQIFHESRIGGNKDVRFIAFRLYKLGVRAETAAIALNDPAEITRLRLTQEEVDSVGGARAIIAVLEEMENLQGPGLMSKPNQSASISSIGSSRVSRPLPKLPTGQHPPTRQQPAVIPVCPGKGGTLDETANFDEYTIYDQGQLNEYGILKKEDQKLPEGVGLDYKSNFDEYTIYDAGQLNEQGNLKKERKLEESAGLDAKAGFDEYTIYDEGQLNEYGLLKAQKTAQGAEAGLAEKADFDEYTIYDDGALNEYGVLKAEREKKHNMELSTPTSGQAGRPLPPLPKPPNRPLPSIPTIRPMSPIGIRQTVPSQQGSKLQPRIPIGQRPLPALPTLPAAIPTGTGTLDKTAVFDDYTIYDEGQLNEYGLLKEQRQTFGVGTGLAEKADFDEYTIYDQGQMNEYGILKEKALKGLPEGIGLDYKADFDEYTIYEQGRLNEYGLLKGRTAPFAVGLDTKADFDEYTIYDTGPTAPTPQEQTTSTLIHVAPAPGSGTTKRLKQRMRVRNKKRKTNIFEQGQPELQQLEEAVVPSMTTLDKLSAHDEDDKTLYENITCADDGNQ